MSSSPVCALCIESITSIECITQCANCRQPFHSNCFFNYANYNLAHLQNVGCPLCRNTIINGIANGSAINNINHHHIPIPPQVLSRQITGFHTTDATTQDWFSNNIYKACVIGTFILVVLNLLYLFRFYITQH